MRTLNKKDYLYLCAIIFSFLGLVVFLSGSKFLYGSQLDWYAQHVAIPEYFRTLFYDTHDFLPNFAFNIGSGQNIYNYSYYGLLSPIILISYIFPNVKMVYFLIAATILAVVASAILMYVFLKNKNIRSEVCFLSVLAFILSSPISFHSHRHIMFMIYMPFLIMGLFGVEKKVNEKRGWLLSLSVFLTIMTNYYYSVGAILALIIYALYCYLKKEKSFKLKDFFVFLLSLSVPFIIAILSSSILTLPTLATLLHNRAASNSSVGVLDILLPDFSLSNILYEPYGLGLNAIAIPAIVSAFKRKKENIFIGVTLTLIALFNGFSFILNGMMYIDSKVLIPFLPLYILIIAGFLEDTLEQRINYRLIIIVSVIALLSVAISRYKVIVIIADIIITLLSLVIYKYFRKTVYLILPLALFTIASAVNTNRVDDLVPKEKTLQQYESIKENIAYITEKDDGFYRISNAVNISNTPNTVYENIRYMNSTTYSSISNQAYNRFYYDILNNNMPTRNRALTVTTDNIISHMLMGDKYMISEDSPILGYKKTGGQDNLNIYENPGVLPLGFSSSKILGRSEFDKLSDFEKQEALLKTIVVDEDIDGVNENIAGNVNRDVDGNIDKDVDGVFSSNIKKLDLNFDEILDDPLIKKEKDGSFRVNTNETLKISYTLPESYKNKILFIRFKMNRVDSENELTITINNVKNKLTESSWRYYNGNEMFDFVIAEEKLSKLKIEFKKGTYNISDFETYLLDYSSIEDVRNSVDPYIIDRSRTGGDRISGNIDVKNDGYFLIQIPYDEGFTVRVDGKETEVMKLDCSYIGCKIEKGMHDIEIEYNAPLKNESGIISLLGAVCFVIMFFLEKLVMKNRL